MILIFANGDLATTKWIEPYLEQAEVIIAADGDLRHLQALNLQPDILIGDLDSVPEEALPELEAAGVRKQSYPRDKDETDLELALIYAAQKFSGPLLIFGVSGGRLDQILANVFLLAHPALTGREVTLLTEYQRAWLIRDQTTISGRVGDRISLLPLGGPAKIELTVGLQWSLNGEWLALGPARGLSNVMTADTATVQVAQGLLLCVHTLAEWAR